MVRKLRNLIGVGGRRDADRAKGETALLSRPRGAADSGDTKPGRGLDLAGLDRAVWAYGPDPVVSPAGRPGGSFVEVIVAAISAGISLVALVISFVVARRQTTIAERLAAIEEARRAEEVAARAEEVAARGRARVTASFRPGVDELVLHNEGPALARGVQAEIESLDGNPLPTFDGMDVLPVDLQPDQPIMFLIIRAMADADMMRVTVRWTDEGGDHQEPYTLRLV
jgi:hypothetical protein